MTLRWAQVEALKWCSLLAMVCDHMNSIVFEDAYPVLSVIGRAAFPGFAFAIAYGYVCGHGSTVAKFQRIGWRLFVVGLIAQPITMYVRGDMVLNVMFTFLVGLGAQFVVDNWRSAKPLISIPLLILLSSFVEYQWFGLAVVLASCYFVKHGTLESCVCWGASLCLLVFSNANAWAFLVVPLLFAVRAVHLEVPRIRGFFYPFYPLHFLALAAVASVVR
jgi:hypothetical protein